jgi:hypothetical protein
VETRATVVARGRHDQDAPPGAIANHVRKQRMSSARRGKLPAADIDDVGALLRRLNNGPCEIQLRTGLERLLAHGLKDRQKDAAAARRDTRHKPVVLAEDHAGDVGTVPADGAEVNGPRHQGLSPRQVRAFQARVKEINRPVQHGDANRGITQGLGPEFSDSREEAHDDIDLSQRALSWASVTRLMGYFNLQRRECNAFPPKKHCRRPEHQKLGRFRAVGGTTPLRLKDFDKTQSLAGGLASRHQTKEQD